jgi:DNA adenine methylase
MKPTLPLFRFVGGKTFLKNKLIEKFNLILSKKSFNRYEEWFAGGLGSFFAICEILKENNIKDVLLNDINSNLIMLYKNIYNNRIEELITQYMYIENEFHSTIPIETYNLNKIKDKEIIKLKLINARDFYKSIVNKFNISTDEFEKSYLLIFLQNHCFNGIYRENLKGEYNTPFNWEAKKIDKDKLTKKMIDIYSCFKQFNIAFSSVDFELIEKRDALIYLDPPYLNQDISENKYSKDLFGIEKQIKLINKIQDYSFIYSNHYDDRIIQKFSKFNTLEIINRKNTISSSNESRKNDKKEILITNLLIK